MLYSTVSPPRHYWHWSRVHPCCGAILHTVRRLTAVLARRTFLSPPLCRDSNVSRHCWLSAREQSQSWSRTVALRYSLTIKKCTGRYLEMGGIISKHPSGRNNGVATCSGSRISHTNDCVSSLLLTSSTVVSGEETLLCLSLPIY